eukprot:jgi/Mesvir1/6115/Mv00822-RA.1
MKPCRGTQQVWLCVCLALAVVHGTAGQAFDASQWTALTANPTAHSPLYEEWRETRPHVFWAEGPGQHMGQVCDVWRTPETTEWPLVDQWEGCATLFLSEVQGNFTVKNLPANQQNNFHNTQKYKNAWSFNKPLGFKDDALPIPGTDMDATCYIFMLNGTYQIGYEEGDGDSIVPCNPTQGGFPFTNAMLMTATREELQEYCNMCYQATCSKAYSHDPRSCGSGYSVGQGSGVVVNVSLQATPAYHCHLTMSNDGACEYVQYKQHETARQYYMPSAVICGWQNLKDFKVMDCDCTLVAGTDNGCGVVECWKMAAEGIACGNCNGCQNSDAREYIFGLYDPGSWQTDAFYHGSCGLARYLRGTQPNSTAHKQAERMCAEAILCPQPQNSTATINLTQNQCALYCQMANAGEKLANDFRCPLPNPARRLLEVSEGSAFDGIKTDMASAEVVLPKKDNAWSRRMRF